MTHLQGDLYNHDSLVKAIKEVDVVISTVGAGQLADQEKLIAAIKEAGNVKVIIIIVLYSLINMSEYYFMLILIMGFCVYIEISPIRIWK